MKNKSANAVLDRLQEVFQVDSDSKLCELIGVKRATLGNWRARESVPYSLCVQIADEKKLSLDWVLTGDGEMYREAKNVLFLGKKLDRQEQAAFELFLDLSPTARKEISAAIFEKKRVVDLENRINQLEQIRYA